MRWGLSLLIFLSIIVSLSPYLINRSLFIGDSWIHLRYAGEILESGRYIFGEYNYQWPTVNLLISLTRLITGLGWLESTLVIPFSAALGIIPLYLIYRRIGLGYEYRIPALLTYIFFPLFPIIIFTSVVMKETSAYYIFMVLLLYLTIIWGDPGRFSRILSVLLSISLVLSHHFSSLVMIYILAPLTGLGIYRYYVEPDGWSPRGLLSLYLFYIAVFMAWNMFTVSLIGAFFIKSLYEALLIFSFITISIYIVIKSRYIPLLCIPLIPLLYLGFRGGIYDLLTREPPINHLEAILIIILTTLFLIGSRGLGRSSIYRGFLAGSLSLFYTFLVWSPFGEGFVVFTKASHYAPFILAPGIIYSFRPISTRIRRILVLALLSLIISTSIYSTYLALNGLSAYRESELLSLQGLLQYMDNASSVNVDVRGRYLIKYYFGWETGFIGEYGYNIYFKVNRLNGLLLGYEWVDMELLLPMDRLLTSDRLFDSNIVTLIYLV